MSSVKEFLKVRGERGSEKVAILFDNGSTRSLIRRDVAERVAEPRRLIAPIEAIVADGHRIKLEYACDLLA